MGGLVQVRLADLRTRTVSVLAEGRLQAPFFAGGLLVWPRSGRPGAQTALRAYSLARRKVVPLPPALRPVTGTDFVVADGTRVAYLSPDLTRLYYSPSPGQAAHLALRLRAGQEFSALGMGRGSLAWSTTAATYVASTVTGDYAQVTPAYGFAVTGQGPALLVADPPASRAAHPRLPLHVLDVSTVLTGRRAGC